VRARLRKCVIRSMSKWAAVPMIRANVRIDRFEDWRAIHTRRLCSRSHAQGARRLRDKAPITTPRSIRSRRAYLLVIQWVKAARCRIKVIKPCAPCQCKRRIALTTRLADIVVSVPRLRAAAGKGGPSPDANCRDAAAMADPHRAVGPGARYEKPRPEQIDPLRRARPGHGFTCCYNTPRSAPKVPTQISPLVNLTLRDIPPRQCIRPVLVSSRHVFGSPRRESRLARVWFTT